MAKRPHIGVERRREKILATARELLKNEPFSMRQLAEASGVSPATPYNIFGTKGGIYAELYQQHVNELSARIEEERAPDGIAQIFTAIRLLATEIARDPQFFRAIWFTFSEPAEESINPGRSFWSKLFQQVQDENLVDDLVNADILCRNFVYLLSGAIMDWSSNRVDVAEFDRAVRLGLALSLHSVVTDKGKKIVERELHDALAAADARDKLQVGEIA